MCLRLTHETRVSHLAHVYRCCRVLVVVHRLGLSHVGWLNEFALVKHALNIDRVF